MSREMNFSDCGLKDLETIYNLMTKTEIPATTHPFATWQPSTLLSIIKTGITGITHDQTKDFVSSAIEPELAGLKISDPKLKKIAKKYILLQGWVSYNRFIIPMEKEERATQLDDSNRKMLSNFFNQHHSSDELKMFRDLENLYKNRRIFNEGKNKYRK